MTDYTDLARRLRDMAGAQSNPRDAEACERAADLADAMGQQEPDGEVVAGTGSLNDLAMIRWCSDYRPKIGDRIYAAPQPAHPQERREPTEAQIVAVADVLLAWEAEISNRVSARVLAEDVIRAALAARETK